MKTSELDDYLIFADIMDDDYQIMSYSLIIFCHCGQKQDRIIEDFEEMLIEDYIGDIRKILAMQSSIVKEWKAKYKANLLTLFDYME